MCTIDIFFKGDAGIYNYPVDRKIFMFYVNGRSNTSVVMRPNQTMASILEDFGDKIPILRGENPVSCSTCDISNINFKSSLASSYKNGTRFDFIF
jgi:hypothetical protein